MVHFSVKQTDSSAAHLFRLNLDFRGDIERSAFLGEKARIPPTFPMAFFGSVILSLSVSLSHVSTLSSSLFLGFIVLVWSYFEKTKIAELAVLFYLISFYSWWMGLVFPKGLCNHFDNICSSEMVLSLELKELDSFV